MRVALGVEYDGAPFSGWETQRGRATVQQQLERALGRVAAEPVRTRCAGRTDAGVHALAQVAHFDTAADRSPGAWVHGTNSHLSRSVSVRWARAVAPEFHARFSARSRTYRYLIVNRPVRSPTLHRRATWEYRPLDVGRMQDGAGYLLGTHDFTAYRARACQARSPVRTVHRLEVDRHRDLVSIDICANGFLHHMVRNVAGVLCAIGAGRAPPEWALEVLRSRDRTCGGVTAPPDGLYLLAVEYPARFRIPALSPSWALW